MIAYKKKWLDNLLILQRSHRSFKKGNVTNEEWEKINETYTHDFYTPNYFIRIGLALLTLIVCLASFMLLMLVFIEDSGDQLSRVSIIIAVLAYVATELYISLKHHFRSGVTETLIWISGGLLLLGITEALNPSELGSLAILFAISTWLSIRFADLLSSIIMFLSFLAVLIYGTLELAGFDLSFVPFLLMICSGVIYFLVRRVDEDRILRHYKTCMRAIEIVALFTLYAAGNYYVIDTLNAELLHVVTPGSKIPFSEAFWLTTILIPPLYITVGIISKDNILYRVGLLLMIALVFTIKYYFNLAPIELLMIIAGIVLIAIAWWLMKFLRPGRKGYTSLKEQDRSILAEQIESIAIAETFATSPDKGNQTEFGGGSFGGAGAGDNY